MMIRLQPFPCFAFLLGLCLLGSMLRAGEAAPSLDARLAALEAKLARLETQLGGLPAGSELAKSVKDLAALVEENKKRAPVRAAGVESKLSLGGFVHANFEAGSAPDARWAGVADRFLLRRARLYATGEFAEAMSFKLEADFGNNSLTPKTGLSGQFSDGYLAWTKFPVASVRLGQFKTPFGFEQLASDTKIPAIERSLASDRLTVGRQVGAQVAGELAGRRVSYAVGAFNGTGTNNGGNDNS